MPSSTCPSSRRAAATTPSRISTNSKTRPWYLFQTRSKCRWLFSSLRSPSACRPSPGPCAAEQGRPLLYARPSCSTRKFCRTSVLEEVNLQWLRHAHPIQTVDTKSCQNYNIREFPKAHPIQTVDTKSCQNYNIWEFPKIGD